MGIINRFLLLLLSLAVAALSLAVLLAALGKLPEEVWLDSIRYALGRMETIAGAAVVFLLSLRLLGQVFARSGEQTTSKGEYVIESSANGEVRVALDAVRNLVDRLAREAHGVRDVRVKVQAKNHKDGATLALTLDLTVGREADVPKLSEQLKATVQQQLIQTMNLTDVPVNIVVADISDKQPAKKHRVV
ncbi:hypothetical protein SAMN02910356_00109 [Selenomonas sp. GACV-9]|uniref:alkaline shock response membrane anchor protein AmaP n=1 Tax=Selenomonas sp. GACV-9 TaxID=3158782 RepID=UPI0008E0CA0B|nr:hypothetical protein SAMN02910356_00109 [Selenomonas ruminantium]